MCGIVGVVSKSGSGFFGDVPDVFEEFLYADGLRGMDSTGCFQVNKKNQVEAIKHAADPGIFFRTNAWKKFKTQIGKNAIMAVGHNRAATVGEIVSKNAHPFIKGDIALVHNGYIGNWKLLDDKAEVDSQAIVTTLLKESDPSKAINQLIGAYAIVWYNHKTRKLFLTRNNDRPLYIIDGASYIFFASEPEMMTWILKRNKYSFPEPTEVKSHTLVEIALNPHSMSVKTLSKPAFSPVPWREANRQTLEGDQSCNVSHWPRQDPAFTDVADAEFPLEDKADPRQTTFGEPTKVKEIQKRYPQDSIVFFEPKQFVQKGMKPHEYVQVRGPAWRPGEPPIEAMWNVESAKDGELYLNYNAPLIGKVSCLWRRGTDDLKLLLDRMTVPDSTLTDYVGTEMSDHEWDQIVKYEPCNDCGSSLNKLRADFTAINRIDGVYRCRCDKCVAHTQPNLLSEANAKTTPAQEKVDSK